MRIRMLETYASPRGIHNPDEIIDLPEVEAEGLIHRGFAIAINAEARETTAAEVHDEDWSA